MTTNGRMVARAVQEKFRPILKWTYEDMKKSDITLNTMKVFLLNSGVIELQPSHGIGVLTCIILSQAEQHQTATTILAETAFKWLACVKEDKGNKVVGFRHTPPYVFTAWDERIVDHPNFWTNLWHTDCLLTQQVQVIHLSFTKPLTKGYA